MLTAILTLSGALTLTVAGWLLGRAIGDGICREGR